MCQEREKRKRIVDKQYLKYHSWKGSNTEEKNEASD